MFFITASVTILPLIRLIFSVSSDFWVLPTPLISNVLSLGLSFRTIDKYIFSPSILFTKILISPIIPCFHSFFIAPEIDSPGIVILSPTLIPARDFNATSSKYFSPSTLISATSYVFGFE